METSEKVKYVGLGVGGTIGVIVVILIIITLIMVTYNHYKYGTYDPRVGIFIDPPVPVISNATLNKDSPGPRNSGIPNASNTPNVPGTGNSGTPIAPSAPIVSITPIVPIVPITPSAPIVSITPSAPIVPITPSAPIVPITPSVPIVSSTNSKPNQVEQPVLVATTTPLTPPKPLTIGLVFDKTPGFFQIGEIEIFADGRRLTKNDVSISGPSSWGAGHTPDVVMDGSTSYSWYDGSVWSSDESAGRGWLNILFNQPMELDKVIIYNRTDCCWDRLNGVSMHIKKSDSTEDVKVLTGELIQSFVFTKTLIPDSLPIPTELSTPPTEKPTGYFGANLGVWNGTPFWKECISTPNDYVAEIDYKWGPLSDWQSGPGTDMSQVVVKCASGSYGSFGSNTFNNNHKTYVFNTDRCSGFSGAKGRAGWGMTAIDMNCNGFSNVPMGVADGGNPWEFSCPPGKIIRAVHGTQGKRIGSIGFVCK